MLESGVQNREVPVLQWLARLPVMHKIRGSIPGRGVTDFCTLIMKTCPCNEDPLTPHYYIVKLGFTGVYIFVLFLL